ncbi:MAG: hypothetical protein AB3A66_11755 [Nodularia sp. CChRGM 3473]
MSWTTLQAIALIPILYEDAPNYVKPLFWSHINPYGTFALVNLSSG